MTLYVEQKQDLRLLLKAKRAAISIQRRKQAAELLISSFLPTLRPYKSILSFHSFLDEIDTVPMNTLLASENRLLLPRIHDGSLLIYQVRDLQNELQPTFKHLFEPIPSACPQVELTRVDCVIVPGLGFDLNRQRIGYGKGHYDRLLGEMKQLPDRMRPKMIGLGLKEQLVDECLPCENHDIALDEVSLL